MLLSIFISTTLFIATNGSLFGDLFKSSDLHKSDKPEAADRNSIQLETTWKVCQQVESAQRNSPEFKVKRVNGKLVRTEGPEYRLGAPLEDNVATCKKWVAANVEDGTLTLDEFAWPFDVDDARCEDVLQFFAHAHQFITKLHINKSNVNCPVDFFFALIKEAKKTVAHNDFTFHLSFKLTRWPSEEWRHRRGFPSPQSDGFSVFRREFGDYSGDFFFNPKLPIRAAFEVNWIKNAENVDKIAKIKLDSIESEPQLKKAKTVYGLKKN